MPLDPTGAVPGRLRLAVVERPAPGAHGNAVMTFSGGPGGAAIPQATAYEKRLAPLLAHRDLVVFDQRGTGVSAPLRCPGVEAVSKWSPGAVAACARRLGERAAFESSADSAADADAIRRALGLSRLTLYGASYGTKGATEYASLYPAHVDGMVLDSVVVPDTDPLYRRSAQASGRVLRATCARTSCGVDAVNDLRAVVASMRDGVLYGHVGSARVALTEAQLLSVIVEGGRDREELPAALDAVQKGDLGPLERLLPEEVPDLRAGDAWTKPAFSATTYLATTCEDASYPWRRGDARGVRMAKARAWLAAQPDSGFFPFDHWVGAQYGSTYLCVDWPWAFSRAKPPKLPDVPALLLEGGEDALTPLEGALEVAGQLPRSRVVVVPHAGHVVAGTPQGVTALRDFSALAR